MSTPLTITGNLTADPERRFTPSGKAVASIRIPVSNRTRNAAGEWTDAESIGWHAEAWTDLAEHIAESLHKGDSVILSGTIGTETWADKTTGDKRTRNKVRIEDIGPSLRYANARVQKVTRREKQ